MDKRKILVQLDTDPQCSVFDGVVAVDSGVDFLFRHSAVTPQNVVALVHGAIFTRSPDDLKNTALFIGSTDVVAAEAVLKTVRKTFFGPMRVSVMFDPNGANTTASAAVLAAAKHLTLANTTALVLAATGPVGQRIVRLLARAGTKVRVASRSLERSQQVCQSVSAQVAGAQLSAVATSSADDTARALDGAEVVFAAGAAGVTLLPLAVRQAAAALKVAIDLNAVPPMGIEGIEAFDKGVERHGVTAYGAIGVGGTKMKIHKAAIRELFTSNDKLLDAEELYSIGQRL